MHRILIADSLDPAGLTLLKESGAEVRVVTAEEKPRLAEIIPDYDALVVRSSTQVTAELMRESLWKRMTQTVGELEGQLVRHRGQPRFWAMDVEQNLRQLGELAASRPASLEVATVFEGLHQVAQAQGAGSQGRKLAGLVDDQRWERFQARKARFSTNLDALQRTLVRLSDGARVPAAQALRRPEISLEQLASGGEDFEQEVLHPALDRLFSRLAAGDRAPAV